MANQIIIDIGAAANDGTGDPLRTAFNYVNDNFSNIWVTGVANSNVAFDGNKILTANTNGNLILAPNGIGKVQSNVDIRPNANNTLSLGSSALRWNSVYTQNLDVGGNVSFADITVNGNLTVTGNIIEMGNIVTDAKTIQLANTANTTNGANGSGITVGANDNIATMLYDSTSNAWGINIGVSAVGNITAPYFIGNGSQLTGLPAPYSNTNATSLLASFGSNTISTTGNITAGYLLGNGSQLTGLPAGYANANAVAYGQAGWAGNIIPGTSNVYSLGNSTNQWKDLWVSNATIYMDSVPISLSAGNVLTVNGDNVVTTNANGQTSLGNLSVDDNNIYNTNGQGVVISNFSFIAEAETAYVQIPAGNSTSDLNVVQEQGNVRLVANAAVWNFGTDNKLTAPGEVYGQYFSLRGGEASGTIGSLGYGGNIIDLYGVNGVTISTVTEGGPRWQFGSTGNTTFPTLSVNLHNGGVQNAQTLQFGDPNQQAVITGPTPTGGASAQRLIIQGQNGGDGEGGDVYLWAGDANFNGGDIKIYAGDADNGASPGYGGYVNIDGGAGFDSGGVVDITGGRSGNAQGAFVRLTGGLGQTSGGDAIILGGQGSTENGGNVTLTAGYGAANGGQVTITGGGAGLGLPGYGNVVVQAGASSWTFDNGGNLIGPNSNLLVAGNVVATGGFTQNSYDSANLLVATTADTNWAYGFTTNGSTDFYSQIKFFGDNSATRGAKILDSDSGNAWVFDGTGVLTVPGEGIIQSLNDTVILQSKDTGTGNTYSARLGTTGGLYFETTAYPLGWLNLTNSSGDANISSPGGKINIDAANGTSGAAGKDINITAGDADQTDYYTTAGGDVNIQGGMGAFNDGGGGGPGGNVNLVAGTSADPAGHAGNINITAGSNTWTFDYNGATQLPGGTGYISSSANTITMYSDAAETNGLLFYSSGAEVYSVGDYAIFADNAGAGNTWRFYANGTTRFPSGGGFVKGDTNQLKTDDGNTTALDFRDSSGRGFYTDSNGYTLRSNGTYNWVFGTTGNLTLPGNTFSVNYANGTAVSLGGNYSDSNVTTLLANLGANTISSTANITTTGNITATNLGNISSLNLNGNASQVLYGNGVFAAVAGGSSYGNADVAANLAAFGSNPISTTGNVTAANFIGNISITGNVTGTSSNVTLVAGSYSTTFDNAGNVTLANSNVFVGTTNTILPNTVASFSSNINSYTQVTNQNKSTGADATADYILTADNGSDSVNYGDFGIINSGYDNGTPTNSLGNIVYAADTYLYASGNVSNTSQSGGNLAIGTTTAAKTVKIFAGGNTSSALVANISNTGVAVTGIISATGNITGGNIVGTLANGNSNVAITANANVLISTAGNANIMDIGADGRVRLGGLKVITGNVAAGDGSIQFAASGLTLNGGNLQLVSGGYIKGPAGYNVMLLNSPENGSLRIQGNLAVGASNTGNIYGGNATFSGNISGNTAGYAIGYRDIPQVAFSANANAALTDAGKHYYSTTAGNLALTLPDNSTTAFPTGTAMTIVVQAAGNLLVNAGTGVTLYMGGSSTSGNRVVGPYGMATVMKVAANVWFINGTGVY